MSRIAPDPPLVGAPADELWFASSLVAIDRDCPLLVVSGRYRTKPHATSLEIEELTRTVGPDRVARLRRASWGGQTGGRRSGPRHWIFSQGDRDGPSIECGVMDYEGTRLASLLRLVDRHRGFDGVVCRRHRRADSVGSVSQTISVIYSRASWYKM